MHYSKKSKNTRDVKMDKKRLKIALAVLDAAESRFPETPEFIDITLKEECEREKITADEVIFYKFRSKKIAWINIFYHFFNSDYFLFTDQERYGR